MKVAVVKETHPGEQRVALAPANVHQLAKKGIDVVVQSGAGSAAGFSDDDYQEKGASISSSRAELFAADAVLFVRAPAEGEQGQADRDLMRPGGIVIGMCDPLGSAEGSQQIAGRGATLFSMELIPRITRAQSMDVLSSMATIAGYRAVLLGAVEMNKMFPMLMTAAGTIRPARVFVIGAGVAGLQAIATARRLGGVVQAYDVRAACREQVESLGARFVELELKTGNSEDKGGYAKEMDEEFYTRQRELMASIVAECDLVITTAAIPGRTSPLLITDDAVKGMAAGSVIVDLAAERGGNCEPSEPDQRVVAHGVTILGPTNLPAEIPYHASQMYGNNMTRFLLNLAPDGEVKLNFDDEIISETLVSYEGEVVNNRIRGILGQEPLETLETDDESEDSAGSIAGDPVKGDQVNGAAAGRDAGSDSGRGELAPIKVDLYADEDDDAGTADAASREGGSDRNDVNDEESAS